VHQSSDFVAALEDLELLTVHEAEAAAEGALEVLHRRVLDINHDLDAVRAGQADEHFFL
jgi:hypothetical protein